MLFDVDQTGGVMNITSSADTCHWCYNPGKWIGIRIIVWPFLGPNST